MFFHLKSSNISVCLLIWVGAGRHASYLEVLLSGSFKPHQVLTGQSWTCIWECQVLLWTSGRSGYSVIKGQVITNMGVHRASWQKPLISLVFICWMNNKAVLSFIYHRAHLRCNSISILWKRHKQSHRVLHWQTHQHKHRTGSTGTQNHNQCKATNPCSHILTECAHTLSVWCEQKSLLMGR